MKSICFLIALVVMGAYSPSLDLAQNPISHRFGPKESDLLAKGEVIIGVEQSDGGQKGSIQAAVLIDAPAEQIWNALTDCDHAPEFVPRLKSCKVLQHSGDTGIIEHQVKIWFLPKFTYTFRANYQKFRRIDFKSIGGDLKELEGSWVLEPVNNGRKTIVIYSVYLDPGFFVPQWLVRFVLRHDLRDLLLSIRNRISELSR